MRQAEISEILGSIEEAEMVLVGLGEEFDDVRGFRHEESYVRGKELLAESGQGELIPLWQSVFRGEDENLVGRSLSALVKRLEDKNYFVVSVSVNSEIAKAPWRMGRLVMPCGSVLHMQCDNSCERNLMETDHAEIRMMVKQMREWRQSLRLGKYVMPPLGFGRCPVCGKMRTLNNVYSSQYDEDGYLAGWQNYTRWLQGTLNRKLLVLELGVGMQFPTVIRFPFEKVAYFNQKAKFYRVNENLYQMTEELAAKGVGIAKNAIDWLQNLC